MEASNTRARTPRSGNTRTLRPTTIALAIAMMLPVYTAQAQGEFTPGTKVLSAGLLSDNTTGVGGTFEYSLLELAPNIRLGIGGLLGFYSESVGRSSYSAFPVLASGNVHLALPSIPALDLFAGASLGIIRTNYDDAMPGRLDDSVSESAYGINIGGRYYFTPTVGGVVQLGFGDVPQVFLGLSLKF